jgi:hypothetical protein
MTSFRLSVPPPRRAAAKFVSKVHRRLQKAYAGTPDVTQTAIADALGVHRSVISRQLRGQQDMSLGRVAELAWAMGYEAEFELVKEQAPVSQNDLPTPADLNPFTKVNQSSATDIVSIVQRSDLNLVKENA